MCTAVGHVSVFRVSTIPRTGLSSRLAIAVLKFLEVISKTAAPVVSEPVPAVVGTIEKVRQRLEMNKRRGLTCDQRSKFLSDRQALAWGIVSVVARTIYKQGNLRTDRGIDEVHKLGILVNREPGAS